MHTQRAHLKKIHVNKCFIEEIDENIIIEHLNITYLSNERPK